MEATRHDMRQISEEIQARRFPTTASTYYHFHPNFCLYTNNIKLNTQEMDWVIVQFWIYFRTNLSYYLQSVFCNNNMYHTIFLRT